VIVHPRLVWLNGLCASLGLALGTSVIFSVQDTVDPLKKIVFLDIGERLGKEDFNPIQRLIHSFSKVNDCVIQRIHKEPKRLSLEVLTKSRHGPAMNRNPF
jgi:hypothetical protein